MTPALLVRAVPAAATRPLRHRVLRPSQPADTLIYPGDDHPLALHAAAFLDDQIVGIASVTPGDLPEKFAQPGDDRRAPWQLRGMATAPEVRGGGFGGAILQAVIGYIAEQDGSLLWCNARTPAVPFYLRYGFIARGDEYTMPITGPHYFMTRPIQTEDRDLRAFLLK